MSPKSGKHTGQVNSSTGKYFFMSWFDSPSSRLSQPQQSNIGNSLELCEDLIELDSIRQVDQQKHAPEFYCLQNCGKNTLGKGCVVDSWQDTEQLKMMLLPKSCSALQKHQAYCEFES